MHPEPSVHEGNLGCSPPLPFLEIPNANLQGHTGLVGLPSVNLICKIMRQAKFSHEGSRATYRIFSVCPRRFTRGAARPHDTALMRLCPPRSTKINLWRRSFLPLVFYAPRHAHLGAAPQSSDSIRSTSFSPYHCIISPTAQHVLCSTCFTR